VRIYIYSDTSIIIYLGNYGSREYYSLEVFYYLLILKLQYPNDIFLLRGYLECTYMCANYGFHSQIETKYKYKNKNNKNSEEGNAIALFRRNINIDNIDELAQDEQNNEDEEKEEKAKSEKNIDLIKDLIRTVMNELPLVANIGNSF
jgi:hypothetical protein